MPALRRRHRSLAGRSERPARACAALVGHDRSAATPPRQGEPRAATTRLVDARRGLQGLAFAALLLGCNSGPVGHGAVGEVAPRLTGKDLAGDYVALADHRGDVVLVNLWATWCAPCRAELPALERLHRQYQGRGFTVLGVSVDSERSESDVRGMVRTFKLSYPILLDPSARATATYEASGYPTSLLVGRDGRVRWRRSGALTDKDKDLLAAIEEAVAEAPPGD